MSYDGEPVPMYGDNKICMRLDIKKVSLVNEVSLHDEVTVTVTGKVTRIDGPEQYVGYEYKNGKEKEVDKEHPGQLVVEVGSVKVQLQDEFAGMDEDE